VDDRRALVATAVVGSVLVRNEDVFVEQAIRNAAAVCDRIHVVDHMSSDRTWDVVQELAREYGHVDVRRARHARVSHEVLEPYVGTDTWVLRIDGDELYDPDGLAEIRRDLDGGKHRHVFRLLGNVLHAVDLDGDAGAASGYLSPPSRPISALYNLGALDSWTDCPERLHAGRAVFREGYEWTSVEPVYEQFDWAESPLRCLHACFLRRSSLDDEDVVRHNLGELGAYRRGALGTAERVVRRVARRPAGDPRQVAMRRAGSGWKQEKYRRGEVVTVDASPFLRA
jgi:Glycosyl transferase family 2